MHSVATAQIGLCTYVRNAFTQKCESCESVWRQAFTKDGPYCNACSGFCRNLRVAGSTKSSLVADSQQTATVSDEIETFEIVDLQERNDRLLRVADTSGEIFTATVLRKVAETNPDAAYILMQLNPDAKRLVDLRSGSTNSSGLATKRTIELMMESTHDNSAIEASVLPLASNEYVRSEWRVMDSIHGRAYGLISSSVLTTDGQFLREAFPTIRFELNVEHGLRLVDWSVEKAPNGARSNTR
jgi:hypothetical protein